MLTSGEMSTGVAATSLGLRAGPSLVLPRLVPARSRQACLLRGQKPSCLASGAFLAFVLILGVLVWGPSVRASEATW